MEQIKKQMDAKLKFCKNEVYSSYDPITQAGLVQLGWKRKLKMHLLQLNPKFVPTKNK